MKKQIHTNYRLANLPIVDTKYKMFFRKVFCLLAILCFGVAVIGISIETVKLLNYQVTFANQSFKESKIDDKLSILGMNVVVTEDNSQNVSSKASRLYLVVVLIGFSTIIFSSITGKLLKYLTTK